MSKNRMDNVATGKQDQRRRWESVVNRARIDGKCQEFVVVRFKLVETDRAGFLTVDVR